MAKDFQWSLTAKSVYAFLLLLLSLFVPPVFCQQQVIDQLRTDLIGQQGCLVEIGGLWAAADPKAVISIQGGQISPATPSYWLGNNEPLLIGQTVEITSVASAFDSENDRILVEVKYTGYSASVSFLFGKGSLGTLAKGKVVSTVEAVFRPVIPAAPLLVLPIAVEIGRRTPSEMPVMPAPSQTGRVSRLRPYLSPLSVKGPVIFADPEKNFLYNEATWPEDERDFCLAFQRAELSRLLYAEATPEQRKDFELKEPGADPVRNSMSSLLSSTNGFTRWHGTLRLGKLEKSGRGLEFVVSCAQGGTEQARRDVIFASGPPNSPKDAAAGPKPFDDPVVQALTRLGHAVAAEVSGGVYDLFKEPVPTSAPPVSGRKTSPEYPTFLADLSTVSLLPVTGP